MEKFMEQCWRAQGSAASYMRTSLDFLIGHYYMLRGCSRRGIELADMSILKLESESATQDCFVWCVIFDNGKTNKLGKKQLLATMRHRDLKFCIYGALAQY
jgi:hypothetical protein